MAFTSLFLLSLFATMPASAGAYKDICFDVDSYGVLRLGVIHSKANKMFVIVGQREVDSEFYAVSGSLIKTPYDGYKGTLTESGIYVNDDDDDAAWAAHWSIDIGQDGHHRIAFIDGDGVSEVMKAELIPCRIYGDKEDDDDYDEDDDDYEEDDDEEEEDSD
jgi:hypothetical protein